MLNRLDLNVTSTLYQRSINITLNDANIAELIFPFTGNMNTAHVNHLTARQQTMILIRTTTIPVRAIRAVVITMTALSFVGGYLIRQWPIWKGDAVDGNMKTALIFFISCRYLRIRVAVVT